MIILLDCNIWITLALNKQLSLIARLEIEGYTITSCQELRNEITNVASRPKFRKNFSAAYIDDFLKFFDSATIPFHIDIIENIVADKKDNYLFALCKASKADYFITGDKLLLKEQQYQQTKIISLADFKALIA